MSGIRQTHLRGAPRFRMRSIVGMCVSLLGLGSEAALSGPIFGVQSPEDLEVLPGGAAILISEMADDHGAPGAFAVLDVSRSRVSALQITDDGRRDWGDPRCEQRISHLSPHGIHLSRRADGQLLLLTINHAEQESVHAYAVQNAGGAYRLAWRGCVETAYNFNDIAATADGFIATHQYDKPMGEGAGAMERLFGGADTGYAVRWSLSRGFRRIEGSEAAFPNGITVSHDGKVAWMAVTAGRQIRRLDLAQDRQSAASPLPLAPDNLSWTMQGQLLVTGALDLARLVDCAARVPACSVPFAVAVIDPDTLVSRIVYRNDGRQLTGASVAVVSKKRMYIGSFLGNHLLEVAAPPL